MTNPYDDDPFATPDKAPAMSFKNTPDGTVKYIDVSEPARLVQTIDFDTSEPAFWPANPGQEPKPKMAAVLNGVGEDGEPLSLWCEKPSDLFSKVGAAQKELGRKIGDGHTDRIFVKVEKRVPAKNPKHEKKIHAVKIQSLGKVAAAAGPDPFADNSGAAASSFDDTPPF